MFYLWNWVTPWKFLLSCIWNLSEWSGIGLGKYAPKIFEKIIEHKGKKLD
jgi:hypothetical protein